MSNILRLIHALHGVISTSSDGKNKAICKIMTAARNKIKNKRSNLLMIFFHIFTLSSVVCRDVLNSVFPWLSLIARSSTLFLCLMHLESHLGTGHTSILSWRLSMIMVATRDKAVSRSTQVIYIPGKKKRSGLKKFRNLVIIPDFRQCCFFFFQKGWDGIRTGLCPPIGLE